MSIAYNDRALIPSGERMIILRIVSTYIDKNGPMPIGHNQSKTVQIVQGPVQLVGKDAN